MSPICLCDTCNLQTRVGFLCYKRTVSTGDHLRLRSDNISKFALVTRVSEHALQLLYMNIRCTSRSQSSVRLDHHYYNFCVYLCMCLCPLSALALSLSSISLYTLLPLTPLIPSGPSPQQTFPLALSLLSCVGNDIL